MTRFRKWLGVIAQKIAGTYREGNEIPPRLLEEPGLFDQMFPEATEQEWISFAQRYGRMCYEEGYVRGYEYVERTWSGPEHAPEDLLEPTPDQGFDPLIPD